MEDVRRKVLDIGTLAAQAKQFLTRAAIRRYRPINADDDVVEMSGHNLDAIQRHLDLLCDVAKTA